MHLPDLALLARISALALFGLSGLLYLVVYLPRGYRMRTHSVLIAADVKTVWDTFFFHISRVNFRPGFQKKQAEILCEDPLIIRTTSQIDLANTPSVSVMFYDVYEPYRRYRSHLAPEDIVTEAEHIEHEAEQESAPLPPSEVTSQAADVDEYVTDEDEAGEASGTRIYEEGEVAAEAGGTRLTLRIHSPWRGFLLPWMARRRTERNLRSLKRVCEGLPPLPAHQPLSWTFADLLLFGIPIILLTVSNMVIRLAAVAALGGFCLTRAARILRRV
jgi:hypothetical protein